MAFIRKQIFFLLIGVLALVVMSCKDDHVEQAPEPVIKSALIQYADPGSGGSGRTSRSEGIIKLSFQFHDADNDLGFDWDGFKSGSINYFLQRGNGEVTPVSYSDTLLGDHSVPIHILNVPTSSTGKLATFRAKKQFEFNITPEGISSACVYPYQVCHLLIRPLDKSIIGDDQRPLEVVLSGKTFYSLSDTLYWRENPEANNLLVEFLEVGTDHNVKEFNWAGKHHASFNMRIPDVVGLEFGKRIQMGSIIVTGFSSSDGLIEYGMRSADFTKIFAGKKIRLRVAVIDKAHHLSNVIESNDLQF